MTPIPIIEIKNLSKSFGSLAAVTDLNLEVFRGDVFGFLGPNGAGKSTTIRMLLSLIKPTSGSILLFGKNLQDHRNDSVRKIGCIIEKPDFYLYLSAAKNLELFSRLSGLLPAKSKIDEVLELVGLKGRAHDNVKTFSHGMKQRLGIAQTLIHDPELIILDEPTTGVDAVSRREFWAMLKNLQKHEITILVSTPYMDEANLCDKISLIQEGRIMASNSPRQIIERFPKSIYGVYTRDKYLTLHVLQDLAITDKIYPFGESLHWILKTDQAPSVPTQLQNIIQRIEKIEPDIEDVFIDYMRNGK